MNPFGAAFTTCPSLKENISILAYVQNQGICRQHLDSENMGKGTAEPLRESVRLAELDGSPGAPDFIGRGRLQTVLPVHRVESRNSLDCRPQAVEVPVTHSHVVGRSINGKVDIDSGNNITSPGFEKARHRVGRDTDCLRQIGQRKFFCSVADGNFGAGNIAKGRTSLSRDEKVVVIAL